MEFMEPTVAYCELLVHFSKISVGKLPLLERLSQPNCILPVQALLIDPIFNPQLATAGFQLLMLLWLLATNR